MIAAQKEAEEEWRVGGEEGGGMKGLAEALDFPQQSQRT